MMSSISRVLGRAMKLNNIAVRTVGLPFLPVLRCSSAAQSEGGPLSTKDFFELLGIERSFSVSQTELKEVYRKLMREYHPDRFTAKPEDEQQSIHEKASQVTHAYQVISDPHKRALHLLELLDKPMDDAVTGKLVGMETLMEVMHIREKVDDAATDKELQILLDKNTSRISDTCQDIAAAFEKRDIDAALHLTAKLQYWNRINETIRSKISTVV